MYVRITRLGLVVAAMDVVALEASETLVLHKIMHRVRYTT